MESHDSSKDRDWQIQLEKTLRLVPGYNPWDQKADSWLDHRAAQDAIDFFPECLKHVEGTVAGQPFVLEPWQQAVIGNLFGWKRRDSKGRIVRRYRELFLYVPRKNGKTPLCAGICLLVLFCDGEPGAQIVSAAGEREQAALLFRHAKGMVEQEPELKSRALVFGGRGGAGGFRSIVLKDDPASVYKVISADGDSKHGGNLHLALIDELHVQPNRDLVDALTTSMASANRAQPLTVFITTADFDRESICNENYKRACNVRDNGGDPAKTGFDSALLPVIYEITKDDDWRSPDVWRKANPNYGVSVSEDYLARECQKAQETPSFENTFRRLHLNQITQNAVRWLSLESWDECADEPDLSGPCFAGLDLASTTDIAAFSLYFPESNSLSMRFWIPEENARQREKRDRVPYLTWARQGLVKLTPGNVIDYDTIRNDINELGTKHDIREFAADRWNATQIITQLQGDGFEVIAYGQGFKDMTAPTKELEKLVMAKSIRHGGNPVLRWMASNVTVETDAAGNLKPSKKKSTEKIDGIVAAIMALGRAMLQPSLNSVYSSRGILTL